MSVLLECTSHHTLTLLRVIRFSHNRGDALAVYLIKITVLVMRNMKESESKPDLCINGEYSNFHEIY